MSKATLQVRPEPSLGRAARGFVMDCRHGTSTVFLIPGVVPITRGDAIATAVARHYAAEGSPCARALRLQFVTERPA